MAEDWTSVDPARAALARARASARSTARRDGGQKPRAARGYTSVPFSTGNTGLALQGGAEIRSGAGPDDRDPARLGNAVEKLIRDRGWQTPTAVAHVMGRWTEIVGPEVADHVRPESFEPGVELAPTDPVGNDEGGWLVLRADSTAWATQMRMLVPTLRRRLDNELGRGIVTKISVKGPTAPSWRSGLRTVPGRGPRDTYG